MLKNLILDSCDGNSWSELLDKEMDKIYFEQLSKNIEKAYNTTKCLPAKENIFRVLKMPIEKIKVVIIGQDPYPGKGQANGLSFSTGANVSIPASLQTIFRELSRTFPEFGAKNGDLSKWESEGVFLLNSSLSVEEGKMNSHASLGWHKFTDEIIKIISTKCKHVCFMLWGGFAKKKRGLINETKHLVLESIHPSPRAQGYGSEFVGNGHFKAANNWLEKNGISPVDWILHKKKTKIENLIDTVSEAKNDELQ